MAQREAVYTHGQHESVLRSHRWRTAANSAAYLLPHIHPGHRVLDIGCGAGTITAGLAAAAAPGRLCAVDLSPEALTQARAALAGHSTVDFAVADVHALQFGEATFDVVHAHQVLQHVTDPVAALREMGRVCRPGGVVGARDADYAAMTWYPDEPVLHVWLDLYRRIARANGGEPDAGRRLKAWANAAGFTSVTASASTWCYSEPAERELWSSTWSERMTSSAIATQAVADGYATPADLERMADGWRRWAEHKDAWFAVLHGEILARRGQVDRPGR
jgi:ubiquinone/menaquinone biosynthesis C-methylase UbiE